MFRRVTVFVKTNFRWWHVALAFIAGIVLMVVIGVGGYEVYEYTETASFCSTCHVMKPQYIVYQQQPHANVSCATCHIGEGASFFIKSKIDGTRQLAATLTNTYERPVPSPVKDLRPARETCQTCHSPDKFTDDVIKLHTHFESDEANTETDALLVLKLGGYDKTTKESKGIHWHIKSKVYYIAADKERQSMQWIGVEDENGKLTEYWSRDLLTAARSDFVATARADGRLRQLDCIDCHNRAAHLIEPPATLVDAALAAGQLDRNLPHLKQQSVQLLSGDYANQDQGAAAMEALELYFQREHPDVYAKNRDAIQNAVAQLQDIYRKTNFPDMKLNWQTYPNNVNHREFQGCFRCHDDKHVRIDVKGQVTDKISSACNLCHSVPIVTRVGGTGARVEPELQPGGLNFVPRDMSGRVLPTPSTHNGAIDLTK